MKIWVWCELVCAACSRTTCGCHTRQQIPRYKMWRDAERAGWVRTPNGDTFCSTTCRDRYAAHSATILAPPLKP